jgi:hypothetical protein
MYTYDIDGLFAIIYQNGTEVNRVGPWDSNNPNGPRIWAEMFCTESNKPKPDPTPEETPE